MVVVSASADCYVLIADHHHPNVDVLDIGYHDNLFWSINISSGSSKYCISADERHMGT
jgi:hypothetical protein